MIIIIIKNCNYLLLLLYGLETAFVLVINHTSDSSSSSGLMVVSQIKQVYFKIFFNDLVEALVCKVIGRQFQQ